LNVVQGDLVITDFGEGKAIPESKAPFQQVRSAYKRRDKKVERPLIDTLRRAKVLDYAGLHDGYSVRDSHSLFLVVRDINSRDAEVLMYALNDRPHLDTQFCVQIGERLIHQQHLRLNAQRPRESDALLLAP
jgi:hypothetical protein